MNTQILDPWCILQWNIISYPLFADVDTGIHPHAASQYHAWPKAKRGIAMLSVDKSHIHGSKQGVMNLSMLKQYLWHSEMFLQL